MTKPNRHRCWWCRSTDLSTTLEIGPPVFVHCHACGATGPSARTKSAAVRLWNRGPKEKGE